MRDYGFYIWSAYGAAFVVLAGLVILSVRRLRSAERRLDTLEETVGRRRPRTGDTSDEA